MHVLLARDCDAQLPHDVLQDRVAHHGLDNGALLHRTFRAGSVAAVAKVVA